MQETWVQSLIRAHSTGHRATKPMHNYRACAPGPESCSYRSLHAPAPVLCNEKLPQGGAHTLQWREAPAHHNWRKAHEATKPSTANDHNKERNFLKLILKISAYLATPGLSCGTGHLWSLLRHASSLVVACELLVAACGIYFPNQGLNLGPLHWECRVLATGPPGKSPQIIS